MKRIVVIGALMLGAADLLSAQGAGVFQISSVSHPIIAEPLPCPPGYACENFSLVEVMRVGGTTGRVLVDIGTIGGTANNPDDYDLSPGRAPFHTLDFPDGFAGPQSVIVVPIQDHIVEPDETVILGLTNPTGGATIGSPSTTTIVIKDTSALAQNQGVPTLGLRFLFLFAGALAAAGVWLSGRAAR